VRPAALLTAPDRVVVDGTDSWVLVDRAGHVVKDGERGDGELVTDPANGLFYFADTGGAIAAHSLRDGAKAFAVSVYFGDGFGRTFIERSERHLLVVSIERAVDAHGGEKPELSVVEVQDLGNPFTFSDTLRLTSARRVAYLFRDTVKLLAAGRRGGLALATEDRLYLADRQLALEAELTGTFVPEALSLDEAGRLHVIVGAADPRRLWVVTAEGRRVADVPVPAGAGAAIPPVVGYDHRVIVVGHEEAAALSAAGKPLWTGPTHGGPAGASVTADDELLVAAGVELAAFGPDGARRVLYTAENALRASPVMMADDEVLVVTDRELVYLAPKPSASR
jgi:hypothetical protein